MADNKITCPSDADAGAARQFLDKLLLASLHAGASDVHIIPDNAPYFRIEGVIAPRDDYAKLSAQDTETIARLILDSEQVKLKPSGSVDGAMNAPDGTRFRFNIFRDQGGLSIALRRLERRFRTLAQLGLPETLYKICEMHEGLVIVTGPAGSGKSTTLSSLLDYINRNRQCHIVTIEDPVEYVHKSIKSAINQRQIGIDASTFNDALVAAMRQDPDVILVGEIRDEPTVRTAIMAAETGHLVLTTLHAPNCPGTIERLISVFPANEQEGVRRQLSFVLRAVIAQHLRIADGTRYKPSEEEYPDDRRKKPTDHKERVVISEVMYGTPAISNLIAKGNTAQIYSAIETGGAHHMYTIDYDLARLCSSGQISRQTALAMARNAQTMDDRIEQLRGTSSDRNRP